MGDTVASKELIKTTKKEIKELESLIKNKIKSGDLRGLNSIQKRLTKLKRKLKNN